tara:strand:+ start:612 stop:1931 length:1320 start_codon:yes stop_codon:yes gene_type:complete
MSSNHDLSKMKGEEKKKLLSRLLSKKKSQLDSGDVQFKAMENNLSLKEGMKELKNSFGLLKLIREENPYFRTFDGPMKPILKHEGREVINFSSYDYLGLASDSRVHEAVYEAIKWLGSSVSASRLASGERPIHQELEKEIADFYGVESALVFVGGYSTNEGVIGHIAGPEDLIIHDSLMHRSAVDGAQLSGAKRRLFPHNNLDNLEDFLDRGRKHYRQCFILVEGIYSMDGDLPDLRRLVELKKKYDCILFVDEAHSLGVLGKTGRGIGEHCGVKPDEVDIWMGTLSKSFASCGGIIAGNGKLIEYLRYTTPAFVYSVGITPANAAAALTALKIARAEPDLVTQVQENGQHFFRLLKSNGLDIGFSSGFNIVPVIVKNTKKSIRLTNALMEEGINAQALFYPVVPESDARLRFFVTKAHSKDLLEKSAEIISRLYNEIC